jgi:hypothetical protein
MLAFRLFAQDDTMGALNLFSEDVGAFDENAQAFGLVFAAHAAIALSGAQTEETLERAAATSDVIGQAKGILIERRHITPSEAFDALRLASRQRDVQLREVAEEIVETSQDPEHRPERFT